MEFMGADAEWANDRVLSELCERFLKFNWRKFPSKIISSQFLIRKSFQLNWIMISESPLGNQQSKFVAQINPSPRLHRYLSLWLNNRVLFGFILFPRINIVLIDSADDDDPILSGNLKSFSFSVVLLIAQTHKTRNYISSAWLGLLLSRTALYHLLPGEWKNSIKSSSSRRRNCLTIWNFPFWFALSFERGRRTELLMESWAWQEQICQFAACAT